MKPNEPYSGTVEALAFGGEGIVRAGNFVVFVPFAIPGDVIEFNATEIKKNYGRGIIRKIINPSPHRVKAPCPIYFQCGGCQIQEFEYRASLAEKSKMLETLLAREPELEKIQMHPPLSSPSHYAYRGKMQLAAGRNPSGDPVLGLYSIGSHDIVDMPGCPIQDETNEKLIGIFRKALSLPGWNPRHGNQGLIRHFLSRTNGHKEAYITVIAAEEKLPEEPEFIRLVCESEVLVKGIALNVNSGKSNVILGEKTKILWGENFLLESIGEFRYRIGPTAFFQVNAAILEPLMPIILDWADLKASDSVLDLYCGAGTFTIPFSTRAGSVVGIEESGEAVRWARENAALNGRPNITFTAKEASRSLTDFEPGAFDFAFADPPRKGLDEITRQQLAKLKPRKILYLSCNPPTLVRDLKFFASRGWKLEKAMAADFFPQTAHIEALALIVNKS